ncbi:MAG: TIGR02757 family protein [Treponema sp.]|nr:TIGR02757 family protein [Treponema sp.]
MDEQLKEKLISLAEKYENRVFLEKDPSKFMHMFEDVREQEITAFTAASLAFGRREQILRHVEMILEAVKKEKMLPSEWILSSSYKKIFTAGTSSFYRMFTHDDMLLFFDGMQKILRDYGSLGECFKAQWQDRGEEAFLHKVIASNFDEKCTLIPHSKDSAYKRINMFLRWMVRQNSPVDLGLWKWFSAAGLLMPLDVHVMQEAAGLGLIPLTSGGKIPAANIKNCLELTKKMSAIFPGDPVRADYALFGLGTDPQN